MTTQQPWTAFEILRARLGVYHDRFEGNVPVEIGQLRELVEEAQAVEPLRAALLGFVRYHAAIDQRGSCSICSRKHRHASDCPMEQARAALAATEE